MGNGFFGNAGNVCHHAFNFAAPDAFHFLLGGQQALCCACFVNNINGFVGQETVVDVFGRQFGSGLQRIFFVLHLMMGFKRAL